MIEYRQAASLDRRLVTPVAREAVARWQSYDTLSPLVEADPPPIQLWDTLCEELDRAELFFRKFSDAGESTPLANYGLALVAEQRGEIPWGFYLIFYSMAGSPEGLSYDRVNA